MPPKSRPKPRPKLRPTLGEMRATYRLPEQTRARLRVMRRNPLFSAREWGRRVVYWAGAVLVGLIALGFAACADQVAVWRADIVAWNRFAMLAIAPAGLAASVWLTRTVFRGAQGSGIPQTIAALQMTRIETIEQVLSLRIAFGKIALTLLGLLSGGSIGREGPTVQVGASVMYGLGRWLHLPQLAARRALILAGGAAGVAAAFNTPLAGIVFAIEELSHSFETRTSGTVLTAVIIAGVTTIAMVGNYTYFGTTPITLPIGEAWFAVLACGIVGGLAGGAFSGLLVRASRGLPGPLGRFAGSRPVAFAAACGLVLAAIGLASHGMTYGTGYEQARDIVQAHSHYPASFFILKFLATIVSYCSGIPGGIFAPMLAVGAGLGGWVAQFLPHTSAGAVVMLGMVGYFSAVVQAPLTATIIVMEMTANQQVTVALMATSFLGFAVSRLVCPRALYGALAERFLFSVEPEAMSHPPAAEPPPPAPAPAMAAPDGHDAR